MKISTALKSTLLILAMTLGLSASAIAADNNQQPEKPAAIVKQVANTVLGELSGKRDYYKSHPEELQSFVRGQLASFTDQQYSALLILGQHRRKTSEEQQTRFADALTDLLVRKYADGLVEFESDEQIEVRDATKIGSDKMRVRTYVKTNDGKRVPVDYVFRENGDQWLVFDVVVEGISYIHTFRNQFAAEIDKNGIEKTIERLEQGKVDIET